jgi:hypothetical protein
MKFKSDVDVEAALAVSGSITLGSAEFLVFGGSGARIYGDSSNNFLTFDTAGLERMRINSSGNVGIGTTAPNSLLQVGDVLSSNKLTIGGYYVTGGGHLAYRSGHGSNSSVWDSAMISATDDGNYNGRLEFKTTTSGGNVSGVPNIKMVIKATGNVGTSPQAATSGSERLVLEQS